MIDMPSGGRQSNPEATFLKANDEARKVSNLENNFPALTPENQLKTKAPHFDFAQ